MSGIVNSGSFPKALQLGVRGWWGNYKRPATVASLIFKKVTSDKQYEEYWQEVRTGVGKIKQQGQGVAYDTMQQGWGTRISNVIMALGIQITHEEIINNLYPKLGKGRVESLKNSLFEAQEITAANILNRAFTSGYTYGDGQILCSTANPNISGGTWSNAASVPADLSEIAIENSLVQIDNTLDDRGNHIVLTGQKLIIAPANKFNAQRILKSMGQSGNANNDENALKAMNELSGGYVPWRYLTAPNAWFITTDCPDGLIHQEREAMSIREDNDTDTFNYKVLAYENYAFGVGDKRSVFGSNGP